LLFSFQ